MELNINNDGAVLVLPEKCLEVMSDADASDMRVLLYIASLDGADVDMARAEELLQMSESEINSSIKFWRGAGVIKRASSAQAKKPEKKPLPEKRIMRLTTKEVTAIGEKNAEFRAFLDLAQQTAGWIFNTAEIEIIASLYANLDLSTEYILALIGYYICRKEQNLRYLEKAAYSLVDSGITTAKALEEELRRREAFEGREGKVRSIFGLGSRKLSAKENEYLKNWFEVFESSDELIALAYEKTVDAIGKPLLRYANGILAKWHEQGIKTPDDALGAPKGAKSSAMQSFDIDDVFNRAINRSYSSGGEK